MKKSKIICRYVWDLSTYLTMGYYHYRSSFRYKITWLLSVLAILMLILQTSLWFARGWDNTDWIVLVVAVLALMARWSILKLLLIFNFRKYAERDQEVIWTIDECSLSSRIENMSEGRIEWSTIHFAVECQPGYLIYRHPVFYWFPHSGFSSQADSEMFREMLNEKEIKLKKVR